MFIYQLASSLFCYREDIQVMAFANSPSVLANFPLISNHLIASSIFPCCRQSWARVATATSQSGSIARASLHSFSAAGISCFHWKIARALFTSGRTFRGFLHVSLVQTLYIGAYLDLSSSSDLSNLSTASWYFCWSSSSSPLKRQLSFLFPCDERFNHRGKGKKTY